jgi:DNA-binding MltR family transcriptional regulator
LLEIGSAEVAISEAQVEAGAKALFELQLQDAREAIDQLRFDPMDVPDLIIKLRTESQTAQVLIFSSYLDDRIKSLLTMQMHDLDSQTSQERMFGAHGPLDTFSNRILIAYHLGWISNDQKMRLDAFRKIRNEFAHRAFKIDFTDPSIVAYLDNISYAPTGIFDRINESVPEVVLTPTVLANLVVLALRTFEQLIVFPIAKAFNVPSHFIICDYDRHPMLLKRVGRALTKSLLLTVEGTYPA